MANKQMNIGNSTSNVDVNITGNLNVNNSDAITRSVLDEKYKINHFSEDNILRIGDSSLTELDLTGQYVNIDNTSSDGMRITSVSDINITSGSSGDINLDAKNVLQLSGNNIHISNKSVDAMNIDSIGDINIQAGTNNANIKLNANTLDLSNCNKTVFNNSGPYGISFNSGDSILHIGDLSLDNAGWTMIDNDCRFLHRISVTFDEGQSFYPLVDAFWRETSPTATSGIVSSTTSNNYYCIKFGNGIMIQGVASRYVIGYKTIVWPTSFVNAEYIVTVGTTAGAHLPVFSSLQQIRNITNTSIEVHQFGEGDTHYQEANKYITAIAIGRWR